MKKPVCLVMGAGAGIGGNVGRRFAKAGYHAVLCRRSDAGGLNRIVDEIVDAGGEATGILVDASAPDALESHVTEIERSIGPIDTVIYNLGAQIGNRGLSNTTPKAFELGWRLATFGLYRIARAALPAMVDRGHGNVLVTSATAAVRGNAGQHSHAAAMGGRRMLCQTLNAEYAPQGIHIAHILVDGAVDAPDTLGKMLGAERFEELRASRGGDADGLMLPAEMAETYFHLAQQHRSAWTHEIDLRSYSDLPWWNH